MECISVGRLCLTKLHFKMEEVVLRAELPDEVSLSPTGSPEAWQDTAIKN